MTCLSNPRIKDKLSRFDIVAVLCLLAAFVFLVWKAQYSTPCYDESFYLAVPYRIWQGDAMLIDEWHPGQLYSFLFLPAISLFITIQGSADGIFLFFRLLFAVAQFIGAVYIYICLRRFNPLGALAGLLAMMLNAPMYIPALSYNTVAILMLSAACATMLSSQRIKVLALLSGLLFAGAVLCCPYLVLAYLVYSTCALVPVIRKKLDMPAFSFGYWLRFTCSCAVLALVFLIFVFSRCSLGDLLTAIPQILSDSEHQRSFGVIIKSYFESFYGNFYFNSFSLSVPLLALLVAIDKKRHEHRIYYIIPAMFITASYFVYYFFNDRNVSFLMFPLNILGAFSYFLTKEKDPRPFVLFFIPGLIYSFCIHLGSNLGLISIGSALTVSGIASSIYMVGLFRELQKEKYIFPRLVGFGLLAAMLLQLCVLGYFRTRYTRWDGETKSLSVSIDRGPLKGLISSPAKSARYYGLLEETAFIRESNNETVMYLYTDTWLYLMDSKKCGSFSNWMSYVFPEKDIQRLSTYWQIHPDRVPDAIFIGDKEDKLEALLDVLPGTWMVTESENGCTLIPVS